MKGRILIVDDDRELCAELAELLESEGYETAAAHDTFTAAKLRRARKFDLCLLDLKLPGDGLKFLREIKKKNPEDRVFVITGNILSAVDDPGRELSPAARRQAKTLKLADGVFIKPFDIEELLAKIALDGKRRGSPA